jgi:alpha-D-ribose 1-methylphosphonate 5-triphosphate diphosphatase
MGIRFVHARVFTPEAVLEDSSVLLENGCVQAIGKDAGRKAHREVDVGGKWILPGFVDLHSDHIEKVIEPRPGVVFPLEYALEDSNGRLLNAGITTIFHSFSFAGAELGLRHPETAARAIRRIVELRDQAPLEWRIHLRYEITDAESLPLVEQLLRDGQIDLLSFMDHSPGQGQYPDEETYLRYLVTTYGYLWSEAEAILQHKADNLAGAGERIHRISTLARSCGVVLACHDLDIPEAAGDWVQRGATLAEFPLSLEAAQAARESGMKTLLGAPNIVRGRSSGNGLRAIDAIAAGLCDIVTSDYAPYTLLPAFLHLLQKFPELDPAHLGRLFSAHPARAARRSEGVLEEGQCSPLLLLNLSNPYAPLEQIIAPGVIGRA